MNKERIRILLIENDHDTIELIDGIVTGINNDMSYKYQIVIVPAFSIKEAKDYLDVETTDLMMFSLSLPNESARDIVSRMDSYFAEIPAIVIAGSDKLNDAVDSIHHGVQDFLITDNGLNESRFFYAVLSAVERYKRTIQLQSTSMIDVLTQLYNSRGFHKAARQAMAIAKRRGFGLSFVFIDIDDLSTVNSSAGSRGGDLTLKTSAGIIKSLFRESDIVARLGSDDFAVIAVGSSRSAETSIRMRLEKAFGRVKEDQLLQWGIKMSFGMYYTENEYSLSVEDHLAAAQKKMLDYRKLKK